MKSRGITFFAVVWLALFVHQRRAAGQMPREGNPLRSASSLVQHAETNALTNNANATSSPFVMDYSQIPPEVLAALYPDGYRPNRQAPDGQAIGGPGNDFKAPPMEESPVYGRKEMATDGGVQSAAYLETKSTESVALASPNAEVADSPGPTLAELLAESNREIRQQREWQATQGAVPRRGSQAIGSLVNDSDLSRMLQRIVVNTIVVLVLAVGFIFVAKRHLMRKFGTAAAQGDDKNGRAAPLRFQIIARLKIGPKSALYLVEAANQRVLVASDPGGIKSLVVLSSSFAETLDEIGDASPLTADGDGEASSYMALGQRAVMARMSSSQGSMGDGSTRRSPEEIEAEMKRRLSEILGGQAFKDVFYKETRASA